MTTPLNLEDPRDEKAHFDQWFKDFEEKGADYAQDQTWERIQAWLAANGKKGAEVAALLDISESHLRYLARKHNVGHRLGDRLRVFTESDVRELRIILETPGQGKKAAPRASVDRL